MDTNPNQPHTALGVDVTALPLIDVVAIPHVLRGEKVTGQVEQGCTLRELGAGEHVYAYVDDERCEDLDYVPQAGQLVILKALPAGDGGGKNMMRLVATIAILALANPAGAALAKATGLGVGLATATVTVAGQLALNALIPPPSQQLDAPNSFEPFRGISGNQNVLNPFGVIPRLYGTHKMYPPMAARPYSEQVGKDQYLRMLFCLGYGPLTIDVDSFKLGDTALSEYIVETEVREGTPEDEPITLFSRNVAETSLSDQFNTDAQAVIRTSPSNASKITLDFVAPALISYRPGKPNPHQTAVGFTIEYKPAGGSTWTTLKPADLGGIATFSEGSEGGYSDNYPYNQAGDNTIFPEGDNAATEEAYNNKGPAFYLKGRDTRPYSMSLVLDMPAPDAYDFRVTRKFAVVYEKWQPMFKFNGEPWLGGGSGGATFASKKGAKQIPDDEANTSHSFTWTAVRAIGSDIAQTVPQGLAFVAMKIKLTDQLGGVVNNFSCVATSRLRCWDHYLGQWVVKETSNPAWVYLDILTGTANARPVSEDRINFDDLKQWALENEGLA